MGRALYCVGGWTCRFLVGYEYSVELVERRSYSALPQLDQGFLLTSPLEILSTLLGLAAWSARFLSAPRVLAQAVLFALPGLFRSEAVGFLAVALALLGRWSATGAARFGLLPLLWDFLFGLLPAGNVTLDLDLHLRLSEYLGTVLWVFKLINRVVYLPAVLFALFRSGRLPVRWFRESRRSTTLGCVVVGACLTPPDILSQLLVAGVLIGFREARRLALYVVVRYRSDVSKMNHDVGSLTRHRNIEFKGKVRPLPHVTCAQAKNILVPIGNDADTSCSITANWSV